MYIKNNPQKPKIKKLYRAYTNIPSVFEHTPGLQLCGRMPVRGFGVEIWVFSWRKRLIGKGGEI